MSIDSTGVDSILGRAKNYDGKIDEIQEALNKENGRCRQLLVMINQVTIDMSQHAPHEIVAQIKSYLESQINKALKNLCSGVKRK